MAMVVVGGDLLERVYLTLGHQPNWDTRNLNSAEKKKGSGGGICSYRKDLGFFLNCENGVGVWVCGVNCEGVVVFGFSGKKKMWRGFWRIRGQGGW